MSGRKPETSRTGRARSTSAGGVRARRAGWVARQARLEEEALARAVADIEKHRKQGAVVTVRDAAGRPVRGASVRVEQTAHEFLFGCNIYAFDRLRSAAANRKYKRLFAELFNCATVGFYWRQYEPVRGRPDYAHTEYAVKFYTMCFSCPAVAAITWWDLCDSMAWLEGGGLLRRDLSPKPAYVALKKLIRGDWGTSIAGSTDAEGRFAFRGFRGAYSVTVCRRERATRGRFVLTGTGPGLIEAKLG